jgi:Sulfotransferase domain
VVAPEPVLSAGRAGRPDEPLLPPEPEPCPPGWVTGPPHFIGVGAQRSGTTWWHRQIVVHPDVPFQQGLHHKEVHFFDALAGVESLGPEEAERYARYFARPAGGGVTGEWTPRYMYDGWPLAQIAQVAPEARILLMLRDPVDRYASGYARENRLARERGEPGIAPAMVEEQRVRGLYSAQVERVLETFPRERVLVLQYERCRAEYERELERTYGFLGLDTAFRPQGGRNAPAEPRERDTEAAERARLARGYAADVARLAEIVPEIDPALWPSLRDRI